MEEKKWNGGNFSRSQLVQSPRIAAFAATAQAAPLMPQPLNEDAKLPENPAQPAVTSKEETDRLQPEEVRGGHGGRGRHRGWGRGRHRGWGRGRIAAGVAAGADGELRLYPGNAWLVAKLPQVHSLMLVNAVGRYAGLCQAVRLVLNSAISFVCLLNMAIAYFRILQSQ